MKHFTAILAFFLMLVSPAWAQTVIGVSLPFTGPAEKLARQFEFGARLALEVHNVNNDRKYELFVVDDGCSGEIAALAIDELRAKKPAVTTGLLCNEVAYAMADAFKDSGIPLLVAGAQSERLIKDRERRGWNLWRLSPGDTDAAATGVAHFSQEWAATPYAIVDDGTVYGRNLADAFRQGMEEAGLPPQFQDNFRPTQSTQARLVRRLRRAGVTHVFIGASAEDVAMIARNSEELEIPLEIAGGEALSIFPYFDPELLPKGSVTAILRNTEIPRQLPDFVASRLNEQDLQAEPYILMGYQAIEVAIAATANPEAPFAEALPGKTMETILGPVRFGADGANTIPAHAIYRWQDGKYSRIGK